MFNQVRYRLLWSYLGVITLSLSGFAIAIRITFVRSLNQRLIDDLTTLASSEVKELPMKDGHVRIDDDDIEQFSSSTQSLQWFDAQGRQLAQQGKYVLSVPPSFKKPIQVEKEPHSILGVTLPVYHPHTRQIIGYVRASESLSKLHYTIHRLDWGLGSGILVALVLSGVGGIWFIRQAMQPIEQSFQQLQQFTADASHELRSPLMAIKTNATVALKYPTGIRDSDVEKFQAIASATQQMTRLTEDLLLLASMDRGVKPQLEVVNLSTILDHLVQAHLSEASAKQIHLKSRICDDLYTLGNEAQLACLFSNLIENALHYTLDSGTVYIQANCSGQQLIINIQDTGVGIAPEHLTLIFDRFWRADQSRSRWAGGSGLGLSIAKGIAQSHGGKIAVMSQLGVGSCFTVQLPAYET